MNKEIGQLLQNIIPLYNHYKEEGHIIHPYKSVCIMRDIGDILKKFIETNPIAPHNLYREIYGKSEGNTNITQKSYVTREFLGRCYRIRNTFERKDYINRDLDKLTSFTAFRESMPFFDNPKYKLSEIEYPKLIRLLNDASISETLKIKKLYDWKQAIYPIKNPRTQKLSEVFDEKEIFVEFYNHISSLVKLGDYHLAQSNLNGISSEYIKLIAKNTMALSQEGFVRSDHKEIESLPNVWKKYSKLIKDFLEKTNAKERNRFRRLVPQFRIVKLSNMLYGISSKENYSNLINSL